MRSEIWAAKDILMCTDNSVKAVSVIKKLVAIEDEDRILLENGNLKDMINRNLEQRADFEYEKKDIMIQDRLKKEQSFRCSSNQIKFRNLNKLDGVQYDSLSLTTHQL